MGNVITLTTDFGTIDGYVGTMHGVILAINSDARTVDISHDIEPHNVRQAAYVIYAAYRFFPQGTVHLVVVDPGVGGARRAVAVRTSSAFFVAPDNGVLTHVLNAERILEAVELTKPEYWLPEVSSTFHGRDIFSPVAAHVSKGVPLSALGPAQRDLVTLPLVEPVLKADGTIRGHVLHIDRFGNVITDIRRELLAGAKSIRVGVHGRSIEQMGLAYADVDKGEFVVLVGSQGHLEIAVREGSAASILGLSVGEDVVVMPAA